MYVVIFEVEPYESGKERYLDLAAQLRQELSKVDGFISIERFQSLNNPQKILSLSTWRDEESIKVFSLFYCFLYWWQAFHSPGSKLIVFASVLCFVIT